MNKKEKDDLEVLAKYLAPKIAKAFDLVPCIERIVKCDEIHALTSLRKVLNKRIREVRKLSVDKLKLAGVFLKYGMDMDDAINLVDEYDIVRVYVPIKKKEIVAAMQKHKITSKRKLFRDILAGDLKVNFNIPKWTDTKK